MSVGDVMGHEPMGIVREVGSEVTAVRAGDRVVVPFNISCGTCWMCAQGLQSQCETTQNRDTGFGASLFGYTKLYGQVPGGQAQYLRVPFGNTLPIKVPEGPADDRFVYLSDVVPTAWQAVQYAATPPTAAARTPSSTPSAWRRTAPQGRPSRRRPRRSCPTRSWRRSCWSPASTGSPP
jgi:threonine dehydrogenase-like Zn-dependent dehydrogenase